MKNGKNIIAWSIIAFVIGIATVIPMAYFTTGNMKASAQTVPFFNPTIYSLSVYCPEMGFGKVFPNGTIVYENAASINAIMDYVMTSETANLKNADALIEVYNFHFYSDQTSIANITHSIAIAGKIPNSNNTPSGVTFAIVDWDYFENTYTFADGTVYDLTKAAGNAEGRIVYCLDRSPEDLFYPKDGHLIVGGGLSTDNIDGEKSTQILSNIKNSQTIYVDITRIMSVIYKHSNNTSAQSTITTTLTNEKLYHVELSKVNNETFHYEPAERYEPDYGEPIRITLAEDGLCYVVPPEDLASLDIPRNVTVIFDDKTIVTGTAVTYGNVIIVTETTVTYDDTNLQKPKTALGE